MLRSLAFVSKNPYNDPIVLKINQSLSVFLFFSVFFAPSLISTVCFRERPVCHPDSRLAICESRRSVSVAGRDGGGSGGAAPPLPSAGGSFPPSLPRLLVSNWGPIFSFSFFYEGDLNMPVLIGLDSTLRLLESPVHSDGRRNAHLCVFPFTSRRQLFEVRPQRPSSHPLLWISEDFTVTSLRKRGNNKAATRCRQCAARSCAFKKKRKRKQTSYGFAGYVFLWPELQGN